MLLERVEALEEEMYKVHEQVQQACAYQHILKEDFARRLVLGYKKEYSNTRGDGCYYMKMLSESLKAWYSSEKDQGRDWDTLSYRVAGAKLMQKVTRNHDTDYAGEVGSIIMCMSLDDQAAFLAWEEVPDLCLDD